MYIGFVYLSTGFLFSKEIPRLIIGYVYILSTIFSILLRVCIYFFITFLYKRNILPKQKVLIIGSKDDELLREDKSTVYTYILPSEIDKIEHKIRNGDINRVLLL